MHEKHFRMIGEREVLSWVVLRLKQTRFVDQIVICSPNEPASEKLRAFSEREGVHLYIYKGDINDVTGRLTSAAIEFNASICIIASGDCPMISSGSIDRMVLSLKKETDAGSALFDTFDGKTQIHEGIIVSRRWLWERADALSDTPELREHHFPSFYCNVYPGKFKDVKIVRVVDKEIYYRLRHRISVDTVSDLDFLNRVYEELSVSGLDFNLANLIKLLQKTPELQKINNNVYRRGLYDKVTKILFYVHDDDDKAKPRLLRSLKKAEKSLTLIGAGINLLVSDNGASDMVKTKGFNVHYGKEDKLLKIYDSFRYDRLIIDTGDNYRIDEELIDEIKVRTNAEIIVVRELVTDD